MDNDEIVKFRGIFKRNSLRPIDKILNRSKTFFNCNDISDASNVINFDDYKKKKEENKRPKLVLLKFRD